MSFGLRNAHLTFQHFMNMVVSGLNGCAVYLDNIAIFSVPWDTHIQLICSLFNCLAEECLTVSLAKCEFVRAKVMYLGQQIGQGQVCPVDAKAKLFCSAQTTKKKINAFFLAW